QTCALPISTSSSLCEVVRTTTGIRLSSSSALRSARTSRPSFLGMLRSRRMRSGRGRSANSPSRRRKRRASSPSRATWRLLATFASRRASTVSVTSPGLSSTRRISMGRGVMLCINTFVEGEGVGGRGMVREREVEGGAVAGFGLVPDPPAVPLDDLLAHRQPDPRPLVLVAGVEALEDLKYPLAVLRGDPDPVVGHRELPAGFLSVLADVAHALGGDGDLGRVLAAELHRVADEVLQELAHLGLVGADRWEPPDVDPGAGVLERRAEVGEDGIDRAVHVDGLERFPARSDAGVGEEVLDEDLHPLRPVDGVGDVLVGGFVELALVAALEELEERGDHPERLLQVVARDVGELLELGVALLERVGVVAEVLLGPALLGDVLRRALERNGLAFGVDDGLAEAKDVADGAVGPDDAVVHLVRLLPLEGRLDGLPHLRAVLRGEEFEVALEIRFEVIGAEAVDAVELVGPGERVSGDLPAPAPDAGDLLRLAEL